MPTCVFHVPNEVQFTPASSVPYEVECKPASSVLNYLECIPVSLFQMRSNKYLRPLVLTKLNNTPASSLPTLGYIHTCVYVSLRRIYDRLFR